MTRRFRPRLRVATAMALVAAVALGLAGARSAGAYRRCKLRAADHRRVAARLDGLMAGIAAASVHYGGEELWLECSAAHRDYRRAMAAKWAAAAPWAMLGLEPDPDPPPPPELTLEEFYGRRSEPAPVTAPASSTGT